MHPALAGLVAGVLTLGYDALQAKLFYKRD
jgi:hypothetical protein